MRGVEHWLSVDELAAAGAGRWGRGRGGVRRPAGARRWGSPAGCTGCRRRTAARRRAPLLPARVESFSGIASDRNPTPMRWAGCSLEQPDLAGAGRGAARGGAPPFGRTSSGTFRRPDRPRARRRGLGEEFRGAPVHADLVGVGERDDSGEGEVSARRLAGYRSIWMRGGPARGEDGELGSSHRADELGREAMGQLAVVDAQEVAEAVLWRPAGHLSAPVSSSPGSPLGASPPSEVRAPRWLGVAELGEAGEVLGEATFWSPRTRSTPASCRCSAPRSEMRGHSYARARR